MTTETKLFNFFLAGAAGILFFHIFLSYLDNNMNQLIVGLIGFTCSTIAYWIDEKHKFN